MPEQGSASTTSIAVWRAGASYDLTGSGRTALKASDSRYGLQVGIDRVTNVNPLTVGSRDCPWGDRQRQSPVRRGRNRPATCPAFSGGTLTNYAPTASSGRIPTKCTAGIETQLPGAVRVGAMFYYRTNREQIGQVNTLQPASAYTAHTVNDPERSRRHGRQPAADDRDGLQHQRRGEHR